MSRKRRTSEQATAVPVKAGPLLTINPNDVYDAGGARAALKLTVSTIRREVRERRLRVSKRAGRYYFLGTWLLEWLAGGELHRAQGDGEKRNGHQIGRKPRANGAAAVPGTRARAAHRSTSTPGRCSGAARPARSAAARCNTSGG